jgi:hypothetical protein
VARSGLFADREDERQERGLRGRQRGDRPRQAEPGRHDAEAGAAEKRTHVGRAEHHAAGPLACGALELIDGERVHGDILKAHEHVVQQDHLAEQRDVGLGHEGNPGSGEDHHGLGDDQPRPAPAEPCQPAGIDDRPPGPLEAPGQHRHGDHAADRGRSRTPSGEVGGEGDRDEAVGNPLAHVEQAEKHEAEPRMVGER